MFKLKIIISTTIFLTLLIVTSTIKNQTRILEKKFYKLDKIVALKEKDINESQLDFYFLTSPAEIEKKVLILGQNIYSHIDHSKIFLSYSDFMMMKKKTSKLKVKNEKKKKN